MYNETVEIPRFPRNGARPATRPMAAALVIILAASAPGAVQEAEFERVTNPFQDGYAYAVGDDLAPNVEIDGVRWRSVRIAVKGDREIEPDRSIPIIVELAFESLRDDAVDVLVVVLLEDEFGNALERLRCDPPFKVAAGSLKEPQFKFKVDGRNLLSTRNVYLFCELQE